MFRRKTLGRALPLALVLGTLALATQASAAVNLVTNGDFSAGNTGFLSAYNYVPQPASPATGDGVPPDYTSWNETTYGVGANSDLYHALWYNVTAPSGAGNYLIVNGATSSGVTVWTETVAVAAHTNYDFSVQATSIYPVSPANLEFFAGGSELGGYTPSDVPGQWGKFETVWNSGAATSVTLSIFDTNLAANGNDFGIDNIALGTPEPSTWAMMVLGFAGLGFAGYRSRKSALSAA